MSSESDWAHALPLPTAMAVIKREPEHFIVSEELGFTPGGGGEHLWLFIEKCNETTDQVARKLTRWLGVKPVALGFSGIKDRFAVTRQWFSVQVPIARQRELDLSACPVRVLEHAFHPRKLKRGTHRGNRFEILLSAVQGDRDALESRLAAICRHGVPNYFGEQRFGRDGDNVEQARAMFAGGSKPAPHLKSILLSSARSHLFNEVVSLRVRDGSWLQPMEGDVCALDGSGSVFAFDAVDESIRARMESGDVHLTGPLWGATRPGGSGQVSGAVAVLEEGVAQKHPALVLGLEAAGLAMERRALRLMPKELSFAWEQSDLRLGFYLTKGAFATTVLRELVARYSITTGITTNSGGWASE